jgi:hypothetical protein
MSEYDLSIDAYLPSVAGSERVSTPTAAAPPTITCPVCYRPLAQGDWPWCPHEKLTGPRAIYVR